MATTVIAAFEEFLKDAVNLDPDDTVLARKSRKFLFDQIENFPEKFDDFPLLYGEKNIDFGSFSRRTKIRPLDDIDMISCLHATGATYLAYSWDDVRITVPESSRLHRYCHDSSNELNSRKIINRYVSALKDVPQYKKADDIKRTGEAATLQLSSYDWNFDIVPAFFTAEESDGRTYYLIPNGSGHWKKTDPRLDRDRVAAVNREHSGNMLNVLRCIKYWQKRPTMVSMKSYLLEAIVVQHFENIAYRVASAYVDIELADAMRELAISVLGAVQDPKQISGDINELSWTERSSISSRAFMDADRVDEARRLEKGKDMKGSINKWREILGDAFPEYG